MKALFAGSFDPFTIGHRSIVERGLQIFDSVVIAIGHNENKRGEWTEQERIKAIKTLFEDNPRVEVTGYNGLTADFAKQTGASVLLRGARGVIDFEYERNLADANREIGGIETVILISEPEYSYISSSMVRELVHNGHDATRYIAGDFHISKEDRHNDTIHME